MRQRVAIVTDSTASIPLDVADQLGISVVQLELKVGEEQNDERRVPHAQLAQAMREGTPVATGEPPAPAFFWNYSDAVANGAEAIISVHISEGLSRTCDSARTAAAEIGIPVYVVDSRLVGLSLGFSVIAAAEAAASGATPQGVMSVLDRRLRSTMQLLYVDTLEYLQRGGRIGRAQAFLGQALSIKPVLALKEGIIDQQAKGIGIDRALKKAVSTAVQRAGNNPVDVGVEHFEFADRAKQVLDELRSQLPQIRRATVAETSAILGAHAGPGALGVTVSPV
ncbi:EDD domain protein, DegV family [Saccharopolyspora antimicrobica]|uniref:DegV family protein with EDD domain n=1 Tax=Saccharopolyspora antimicrobica TaxID=455193 RepID=A0A1I4TE35_9PSEU|nr:DegV family protein [Saccharopolyspora antimicrobica]RKT85758.1 DegV family protein with EDD domain [Saccharopolyspora antimicrobica]SFM74830.1 EDD domain protein, DegV family [Saccharopolyspora antimicrobica]